MYVGCDIITAQCLPAMYPPAGVPLAFNYYGRGRITYTIIFYH